MPAAQGTQTGGAVAEPGTVCSVPAAHAPCGRQTDWFWLEVYVLAGQASQVRSEIQLPGAVTCSPGLQVVHAVHFVESIMRL